MSLSFSEQASPERRADRRRPVAETVAIDREAFLARLRERLGRQRDAAKVLVERIVEADTRVRQLAAGDPTDFAVRAAYARAAADAAGLRAEHARAYEAYRREDGTFTYCRDQYPAQREAAGEWARVVERYRVRAGRVDALNRAPMLSSEQIHERNTLLRELDALYPAKDEAERGLAELRAREAEIERLMASLSAA